jgi:HEAT repeat protein
MKTFLTAAVVVILTCPAAWAGSKEEQVAKYVKDLKSKDAGVRVTAAEEIGKIGQVQVLVAKPAVQPLLEATSDKDAKVRAAAADALGRLDEAKEVVPVMVKLLKDDANAKVREAAAKSLGLMGEESKEALPTLREVVQKEREKSKTNTPLGRACADAARQISGRAKP